MPKFLDVHSLNGLQEETLRKLQQSPIDEFGITHNNLMYNKGEDKLFCLLDAPNKEAVENHHHKAGVKCEWIMEVKTTTWNKKYVSWIIILEFEFEVTLLRGA